MPKKETSLEKQKSEIVRLLYETKLKLVIFIDDLDRLNAQEVLSIFSLVRSTFNFRNVIFVIAYDREYIHLLLQNENVPQSSLYFEKIFQFEIDLPSFPDSLLTAELIALLTEDKNPDDMNRITAAVRYIDAEGIFKEHISNLRECVRLTNSFNHIFDSKSPQIDIIDFLLLELLRLKAYPVYAHIKHSLTSGYNPYPDSMVVANQNKWVFRDDVFVVQFENICRDADVKQELIQHLLKVLFNRTSSFDIVRHISIPDNILRYFSDDLFVAISIEQFEVYKKSKDRFKSFIDSTIESGRTKELENLMTRVTNFFDTEVFYNFCKGACHFANKAGRFRVIDAINFLWSLESFQGAVLQSDSNAEKLIKEVIDGETYPYQAEVKICEYLLIFKRILKGITNENVLGFYDQYIRLLSLQATEITAYYEPLVTSYRLISSTLDKETFNKRFSPLKNLVRSYEDGSQSRCCLTCNWFR